jgi:hypothetical protein
MKIFQWMRWLGFGAVVGLAGMAGAADEPLKECPQCRGTGSGVCRAGCEHGLRVCPGKCLKASVGKWEHLKVEGHGPNELWQKFTTAKGYRAWNQSHLGEVVEMRNGDAVLVGKCPVCGGTTKIKCSVCAGEGQVKCLLCNGTGQVAQSVQPAVQPGEFALKDGRVLRGKITMQRGEMLQIRTEEGKTVTINRSELADPKAARFR